MSRSTQLFTSYLQAVIFAALGVRCYLSWQRERDRRSAHLALAAGLFGTSSLMSAITNTFIDSTKSEVAPRWESIISSIVIFLSIYFFLLFLSDFIPFPKPIHVFLIVATAANIVLAIIERPDIRFDFKAFRFVRIPGVSNPIRYLTYLKYVLVYWGIAFGILALAFLVYGFRSLGLARFRLLSIGSGFLLLCVVIGLLPFILFGHPDQKTAKNLLNVLVYVALVSGPLLLVGFSPPNFVRRMFPESVEAPAGR